MSEQEGDTSRADAEEHGEDVVSPTTLSTRTMSEQEGDASCADAEEQHGEDAASPVDSSSGENDRDPPEDAKHSGNEASGEECKPPEDALHLPEEDTPSQAQDGDASARPEDDGGAQDDEGAMIDGGEIEGEAAAAEESESSPPPAEVAECTANSEANVSADVENSGGGDASPISSGDTRPEGAVGVHQEGQCQRDGECVSEARASRGDGAREEISGEEATESGGGDAVTSDEADAETSERSEPAEQSMSPARSPSARRVSFVSEDDGDRPRRVSFASCDTAGTVVEMTGVQGESKPLGQERQGSDHLTESFEDVTRTDGSEDGGSTLTEDDALTESAEVTYSDTTDAITLTQSGEVYEEDEDEGEEAQKVDPDVSSKTKKRSKKKEKKRLKKDKRLKLTELKKDKKKGEKKSVIERKLASISDGLSSPRNRKPSSPVRTTPVSPRTDGRVSAPGSPRVAVGNEPLSTAVEVREDARVRLMKNKGRKDGRRASGIRDILNATGDAFASPRARKRSRAQTSQKPASTTITSEFPCDITSSDEVELERNDFSAVVVGCTRHGLIEMLTHVEGEDALFRDRVLFSLPSLLPPEELVERITARYDEGDAIVKHRCISVMARWMQCIPEDFRGNDSFKAPMRTFVGKAVDMELMKLYGETQVVKGEDKVDIAECPVPYLPPILDPGAKFDLLQLHPTELARQLARINFRLFKKINPRELLNQAWMSKQKEEKAANLIALIERFNLESQWASTIVVKTANDERRASIMSVILKVAKKSVELKNFSTAMAIFSGLNASSVQRLKDTWARIPPKKMKAFNKLEALMSMDGNYKALREHIKEVQGACIPFCAVLLHDLTFIEDGNPSFKESGMMNFEKHAMVSDVILMVHRFQNASYNLAPVKSVETFLTNLETINDDELYKLSLVREARRPKEVIREKEKEKDSEVVLDELVVQNPLYVLVREREAKRLAKEEARRQAQALAAEERAREEQEEMTARNENYQVQDVRGCWRRVLDVTVGDHYYWNKETKETTWDPPDVWKDPEPEKDGVQEGAREAEPGGSESAAGDAGCDTGAKVEDSEESSCGESGEKPNVRGGWKRVREEASGDYYYWNKSTNETTWDVPEPWKGEQEEGTQPSKPVATDAAGTGEADAPAGDSDAALPPRVDGDPPPLAGDKDDDDAASAVESDAVSVNEDVAEITSAAPLYDAGSAPTSDATADVPAPPDATAGLDDAGVSNAEAAVVADPASVPSSAAASDDAPVAASDDAPAAASDDAPAAASDDASAADDAAVNEATGSISEPCFDSACDAPADGGSTSTNGDEDGDGDESAKDSGASCQADSADDSVPCELPEAVHAIESAVTDESIAGDASGAADGSDESADAPEVAATTADEVLESAGSVVQQGSASGDGDERTPNVGADVACNALPEDSDGTKQECTAVNMAVEGRAGDDE